MLETNRLILRRWEESDAESLDVIRNVFNGAEAYAICFKSDGKAIGAIELKLNGHTDLTERDDECELGYWLGKPFWGKGIMPEAAREMLRHAFEDLGMQKVWCGYYDGNTKSKRVQEKCGFCYQWTTKDVELMSLPCSNATDARSVPLAALTDGEKVEVVGSVVNPLGNLWYEVSWEGRRCYLFSGYAEEPGWFSRVIRRFFL